MTAQKLILKWNLLRSSASSFVSVFTSEDVSVAPCANSFFSGGVEDEIRDIVIDAGMLMKVLSKVRQDKSSGVDEVSYRFISETKNESTDPLVILMNESRKTGVVL